jgi:hypothetical protein
MKAQAQTSIDSKDTIDFVRVVAQGTVLAVIHSCALVETNDDERRVTRRISVALTRLTDTNRCLTVVLHLLSK